MTAADPLSRHQHHSPAPPAAVHDPVCGMTVDPAKAKHRAEHAGHSYYFCGAKCREKFAAEPARYALSPRAGAPEPARASAERGRVDLPDAPANRAQRARQLPDLRHGPRADDSVG